MTPPATSSQYAETANEIDCRIPLNDRLAIRDRSVSAIPTSSDGAIARATGVLLERKNGSLTTTRN